MNKRSGLYCAVLSLFLSGCVYHPKKQIYYDEVCDVEREVTEVSRDYYKSKDGRLPATSGDLLMPVALAAVSAIFANATRTIDNSIESKAYRKACLEKGIEPNTRQPPFNVESADLSLCNNDELCAIERTY
ncbi:hypothetical protein [Pseudoalteromonas luteoviolacea]|uniref:hypothetical protein n=1 Tax=Pseudoalteromonas luteoviolacea TaxID=43657 RepID=UPI00115056D8|nr:hypothetical protein [Pseudoalteromonas luteoviolacea]TQF68122.1 hypothetical protein FLM44_23430 [Pseudoalteromonas luteoviolacea]